jgi:hypothetical protein
LEEKLTTDFTDFADLFGHKKAQKTRRKIGRRLPKLTEIFWTLIAQQSSDTDFSD